MCMPKESFFCVTHPQKVFLGGFILGYLAVKDYENLRRNRRNSIPKVETFGLLEAPFDPVPYPYTYHENPKDSQELMLNQARLARDAKNPQIIDQDDGQPAKLGAIHYDYESMRSKYEL